MVDDSLGINVVNEANGWAAVPCYQAPVSAHVLTEQEAHLHYALTPPLSVLRMK